MQWINYIFVTKFFILEVYVTDFRYSPSFLQFFGPFSQALYFQDYKEFYYQLKLYYISVTY